MFVGFSIESPTTLKQLVCVLDRPSFPQFLVESLLLFFFRSFLSMGAMDDLQGRWAKLLLNTKEIQMVNFSTNVVEKSRVWVAKFLPNGG